MVQFFKGIIVVKDLYETNKPHIFNEDYFALLSTQKTGVLALQLTEISSNFEFIPTDIYQKAIFLSWGFLIRKSICDELDIESSEFNLGYRISPNSKSHEIFIVETADNGAGYTNYLNGKEDADISRKVFIENLLPNGKIYSGLIKESHSNDCLASCYDCLRDYYNQNHHYMLNWRFALDLAELSSNKNAIMNFSQEYWLYFFSKFISKLILNKYNGKLVSNNDLYSIEFNDGKSILIKHPFWNEMYVSSLLNDSYDEAIHLMEI